MPERVYIGLGTNLGDKRERLLDAAGVLNTLLGAFELSSLYRTEPVGVTDQPEFLNAVATGITQKDAVALLSELHAIERGHGRNRTAEQRWGPRALDLDLLLFGEEIIQSDVLTLPHPELHKRAFVLVPLAELAPELSDPHEGRPYVDYLKAIGRRGVYYEDTTPYTRGHHAAWKNHTNRNPEDISESTISKDH